MKYNHTFIDVHFNVFFLFWRKELKIEIHVHNTYYSTLSQFFLTINCNLLHIHSK